MSDVVRSDGVEAGFAGADADNFLDVGHEDLSIADATRLRSLADGVNGRLDGVVAEDDLDLHLRQEVHHVFSAAVEFGVTLLATETLRLGDGDALQADFLQRLLSPHRA
jgi:hypothetical protein